MKESKNIINILDRDLKLRFPQTELWRCLKFLSSDNPALLLNIDSLINTDFNLDKFDMFLSKINEVSDKRKSNGVYYTPSDVSDYITCNSLLNYLDDNNCKVFKYDSAIKKILTLRNFDMFISAKIFDPTCGTGVFLLSALKMKLFLLSKECILDDNVVIRIASSVFGNDIDLDSIIVSKIRLFIECCKYIDNSDKLMPLAISISKNFYSVDFICDYKKIRNNFDVIVGNPPYVEYRSYAFRSKLKNNFGNVYADVIRNSFDLLCEDGVLGFIIPLSYVSTVRMSNIRDYVNERVSKQFVLNYADRPDCLFSGVHQKLSVLICKRGKKNNITYTSNYVHWYKNERSEILNGRNVYKNTHIDKKFIPKIGNRIENSIYKKVTLNNGKSILDSQSGDNIIFLNMRGCF